MPHGYDKVSTMDKYQKDYQKSTGKYLKKFDFDLSHNPQMKQSLQELQGVSNYANDLMSPTSQAYQNFAAPEMRNFNEETMPDIAEQFAGVGGLSSSGFQQAATGAGAGLQERLAALRSGLQMQGATMLSQLSSQRNEMAMQPYEMALQRAQGMMGQSSFAYNPRTPKQPSVLSQFGGNLLGAAATGLGTAFGGPIGGALAGGVTNFFSHPKPAQSTWQQQGFPG